MQLSENKVDTKGYTLTKLVQIGLTSLTELNKKIFRNRTQPTYDQYKLSDEILTAYKSRIGYYR
ncbi:hypothetical protein [Virgibacillus ndiopensis]|uniref:hypothetical protein n=1 Tax=Virgibacillus ndiopensis TaxID=2004408 RepID=UPI000C085522|nr:hypothetical protein [Virgibacillus ndiopensis]